MTDSAWDIRNRPKTVDPIAGRVTFAYDALDRRTTKQTPTANFVHDFEHLLREVQGGTTVREYTSTTDPYGDLLSAFGSGATSYYEFEAGRSTPRRPWMASRPRCASASAWSASRPSTATGC